MTTRAVLLWLVVVAQLVRGFHDTHHGLTKQNDEIIYVPLEVNCSEPVCLGPLSPIYCIGPILTASWQFGMHSWCPGKKMLYKADIVRNNFDKLKYPMTKADFTEFCIENFANVSYMELVSPKDWKPEPAAISSIKDDKYKSLAQEVHLRWRSLLRKFRPEVLESPDLYPVHTVKHPFIVPGGFFQVFFYWDSYWIIKGLLRSEMLQTAKGMIQNFADIIDEKGFIPNSGEIQHARRTQPPLFIQMIAEYFAVSRNIDDVTKWIPSMEREMQFWLDNRRVKTSEELFFVYRVPSNCPRPENFLSDYNLGLSSESPQQTWRSLASGCESGWDFSVRWFNHTGDKAFDKSTIRTDTIVPVDLNVFMALNFETLAQFSNLTGDTRKASYYTDQYERVAGSIMYRMYNREEGSWFDLEANSLEQRKQFYPSNIYPLLLNTTTPAMIQGLKQYLKKTRVLEYPGGVPASAPTGTDEQWDYPNVWAPNQHLFVMSLLATEDEQLRNEAVTQARKFIDEVYRGLYHPPLGLTGGLWEKYDVRSDKGRAGGGGEYPVQEGFGWTNGAALDLIVMIETNQMENAQLHEMALQDMLGGQPHVTIIIASLVLMICVAAWFLMCGSSKGTMCVPKQQDPENPDSSRSHQPLLLDTDSE